MGRLFSDRTHAESSAVVRRTGNDRSAQVLRADIRLTRDVGFAHDAGPRAGDDIRSPTTLAEDALQTIYVKKDAAANEAMEAVGSARTRQQEARRPYECIWHFGGCC